MNYTEPIVKGKKYKKMLKPGISLVLEGGGMRGFHTAGVLDAFMERGIMFSYIAAVSAGAANALSYVSGQQGRNRIILEKYVKSHKYFSMRNLISKKSLFDFEYIFKTIPSEHLFFDFDMFHKNETRLMTGTINCETGKSNWYEKESLGTNFLPAIASCSIPMFAQMVEYEGELLLDGGISDPIPIEKAIEDGNTFHVIVLTRNEGYRKRALRNKALVKRFYRKYPKLAEAVIRRHEIYNRQIELCEKLEREGRAIIIRPEGKLKIDRLSKNINQLLALYDAGVVEGRKALDKLSSLKKL